MERLRKACGDWKKETNIGFALYGTPPSPCCYRFARIDKERFGTIPDVTDKGLLHQQLPCGCAGAHRRLRQVHL
ncbi:MAG: anaerobic ribonucleoside-triphosphate reductase [Lawsonibacter sp.]